MNNRNQLATAIWGKYKEAYPNTKEREESRFFSAYKNRNKRLPTLDLLKEIALDLGYKIKEEYSLESVTPVAFILDPNIPLEHKLSLRPKKS